MQQFRPAHFARLKHLAVFAIVVDAGSFTKAGKRLGLAKSAVSRYVSELEEEVGIQLLTRTTRTLVLTEPGERFYVDCARLVEAATDSFDAVEPDAHLLGSLRVGATQAFGRHVLLPAIKTFLDLHPKLSVQLSLDDRHVDLVTQGIDLSFRIGSPGTAPSYISRTLATMRFELFASREFVGAHDVSTVEALESLPWILSPLGPTPETWTFRDGEKTSTLQAKTRLVTDSAEVAVHAAELGMGIVGIPNFMRSACAGLTPVLPALLVEPELSVLAVYPRRRFVSPRVRGFLAHLEPHLNWSPP